MSEKVRTMFANIAPRYDLANTALSFGIHHWWRHIVVRRSHVRNGMKILDCATGTGDLAIAYKHAVGSGTVIGTDFCAEMLSFAPHKAKKMNMDIQFEIADVLNLPYPNDTFDIASISFGIRNVDNPQRGLEEMARTVKSGGKVVVLEFGQPRGLFRILYTVYSRFIMPRLGGLLTGNASAYEYLPETAARFPSGEEFTAIMRSTNAFSECRYESLTFGIAYLYIGIVR
jgi:demethylmenaquinone methyltransferase/2-methoxy-6-polyprenyl-1,4-benzoquinol methylase